MKTAIYSPQLTRRILASGAIGNILETYDLILISLMATTLSQAFFPPAENPYAHVVEVMYVFLIGLLIRPIGNIVMSLFSDQIGRKKLMVITLICTGLGTILIGLLPQYAYIGIWSTILFVLLRLLQNFFAGIEYINSATYLIENSKDNTKGYYASWTAVGISGGYLLASLTALLITSLISKGYLPVWSWRLIFFLSLFGVFFGFWIRKSIPESLTYMLDRSQHGERSKNDILIGSIQYIKNHFSQCIAIGAITLMGVCLTYIYYIFIPINLVVSRHFSQIDAYSINSICLIIVVALIPLFGKMSDKFGRTILLKGTCLAVISLAMPLFWLSSYGTYLQVTFIIALISIPSACFFSLYPAIITESFPSNIRCTTASLIYQIIVSIEMGFLPLIVNKIIEKTGQLYSPSYLLIASAIIGLIGIIYLEKNQNVLKESFTI